MTKNRTSMADIAVPLQLFHAFSTASGRSLRRRAAVS